MKLGIGETYALLTALFWAVAVIFFKLAGRQVVPQALNLFKNSFALLLFLPTLYFLNIPFFPTNVPAQDWYLLLFSGAIGIALGDTLFFASLNRLGAGLSAIVDCLYSPFVILFAFFLLGERLTRGDFIGAALIVFAVLSTYSKESYQEIKRRDFLIGVALGAVAMAAMAFGIVIIKDVLVRTNVIWVTTVRLVAGILFLALAALRKKDRKSLLFCFKPGSHWKVTVPGSFFGGYLGLLCWLAGMKYTMTSVAAILNQLSTVLIIILAYFTLQESLTRKKLIAALMAVIGVLILIIY